jgi:hypothetical protein
MKLSVYSLKKILFQGDAQLLNCKTVMGEITVLDNHEPLITVLSKGPVKIVKSGTREATVDDELLPKKDRIPGEAKDIKQGEYFFEIKSGFLEVRPDNEVRCIVEI